MTPDVPREGGRPGQEEDVAFVEALRGRWRAIDVLALLGLPAVLLGGFLLPDRIAEGLVLSHADPSPLAAVTAHYVHRSADHLVGNLSVYALVVPTGYLLCLLADRRREFFVAFATYLLALPPVLSALDLALLPAGVVLGFSGVAMAFVGFLPVAIVWYVAAAPGAAVDLDDAPALFFLGLAAIALWGVPTASFRVLLAGAAGAIGLAYALGARSAFDGASLRRSGPGGYPELGGVGLVAFAVGIAAGFPGGGAAEGVVVNQYGHLLGYSIGFVAAYVTFRPDASIR